MSNNALTKYVMYCRKSSDSEDRQVMSLEAQERELWNIANRNNIEVVKVFRESMSAKEPGRPDFAEMLEMINKGEATGILCWKLDRLSRNPIDGGSISWMLQRRVISSIKTFGREYLPNDSVVMMSLEFGMSNQYIIELSENVKRGNREKLHRGEWPNHAPYGYRNDKNTKTLIFHEAEAKKVVEMYRMYATGKYSLREISKSIGVRKSLVDIVLKKTFYYGLMERDGAYYPRQA